LQACWQAPVHAAPPRRYRRLSRPPQAVLPIHTEASVRLVAADGDPVAVALVGAIVPDRTVLQAAGIPECDRIWPPLEAHAKLRRLDVLVQHVENCRTLALLQPYNACREEAVDKQALLARYRVRAEYGVLGTRICLAAVIGRISSAIDMLAVVDCR